MVAAGGLPDPAGDWIDHARSDLAERLPELDGDLAGFVVDGPDGRPVSAALGVIQQQVPGPRRPDGRVGHVFNVATDVEFRGNGYASGVMTALLDWFRARGVEQVDLNASSQAEHLYERLGFTPYEERAYTIRLTPSG